MRSIVCILTLACSVTACSQLRLARSAPTPLPAPPPQSVQLSGALTAREPISSSRGAIVYLEPVAEGPRAPSQGRIEASILRGRFEPDPAVALLGSRVAWTNADSIYHGVFSVSRRGSIDLGVFGPGERRELELGFVGAVRVHCPIHVDEAGVVFVAPSRHFVRASQNHRYLLKDVPPGRYWLRAWSDGWSADARDITLRPGESAQANLVLRRDGA